jgi:hypothetical protein
VFAVCPIPENYQDAVVKCQDSSRGFAVRLSNNGKFAWVGAAFRERSDAFDFNVCFTDWQQKAQRDNTKEDLLENNNLDFSLK